MTFAAYANAQCTGTATVGGPTTDLGSFVFDRTGSTATLNAFWGAWNQPNGRTDRVVWARKYTPVPDVGPKNYTVFPSAAGVESYVDLIIPNKTCYVKD